MIELQSIQFHSKMKLHSYPAPSSHEEYLSIVWPLDHLDTLINTAPDTHYVGEAWDLLVLIEANLYSLTSGVNCFH